MHTGTIKKGVFKRMTFTVVTIKIHKIKAYALLFSQKDSGWHLGKG